MVLLVGASAAAGQSSEYDICVLEHLTVTALEGRVVSTHLDGGTEKPLAGATIELRRIGQLLVIANTTTDSAGNFALSAIAPGAYSLAAKPPGSYQNYLFATAVEVQLKKRVKDEKKEIALALGAEFAGCHGGYAS